MRCADSEAHAPNGIYSEYGVRYDTAPNDTTTIRAFFDSHGPSKFGLGEHWHRHATLPNSFQQGGSLDADRVEEE